MPVPPSRNCEWLTASNGAGGAIGAESLSLVLTRGPGTPRAPHIERISSLPENRTKWAPAEPDILRCIFEGIRDANNDFGTCFVASHIRYEAYNTNRAEVYGRLSYEIIEAAYQESGRHAADGDERDWRLPAHRLQILRDALEHWPPTGELKVACGRLRTSILMGIIFGELKHRCGDDWQLLSIPRRTFAAVDILEHDIYGGGLEAYFINSSGDSAREAYEGLLLIGAPHLADILQQAMAEFPFGLPPRDREEWMSIIRAAGDRASSAWQALDQKFTDCYTEPTEVEQRLLRYILRNADEFFDCE